MQPIQNPSVKRSHFFLKTASLLSILSLCAGCASDVPIKNIHEGAPVPNTATSSHENSIQSETTIASHRKANLLNSTESTQFKLTDAELQKFAYELGLDANKVLTAEQKSRVLNRKKLRQLERTLDSQKERLQYSKVLPLLDNDVEKIELLSIQSIEGRQVWINGKNIWERTKQYSKYDDVVDAQDLAIGMPPEYVRRSWGEPTAIEVSGNPIYRNERWNYLKQVSTPNGYKQERRLVYFEEGRVAGWETE